MTTLQTPPRRSAGQPATGASNDALSHDMNALLEQLALLVDGQQRLLEAVRRRREAIRTADLQALTAVCREEQRLVEHLGAVQGTRARLMERISRTHAPHATAPLRLDDIVALAPQRLRGALEELGRRLRAASAEVQRESAIVRVAAESLSRHLSGIVQTVHAAVTHSTVYGRRGRMVTPPEVDCCIDLKS